LEGNDGFRLFINEQLIIDRWQKQTFSLSLADFRFEKDKHYAIRVEFTEPVGNAHLKLVWNVGVKEDWKKKNDEAVALAKKSDVAVVVVGITEGEFQDRAMLSLPGHQEELIKNIALTGKQVVVVLVGGSAVTMNSWVTDVQAILDVWYPGEEGGRALAEVLFGDANPAGRLPITFPQHEAQLPLVYNHKPTGRGDDYNNLSGLPLFPFGYGLSYTSFSYENPKLNKTTIGKNESAVLQFEVTNSGKIAGEEVVQLYVKDLLSSVVRPVMELKGFQRIALQPGEKKVLSFTITPEMLSMLNKEMKNVIEPGAFHLLLGSSSRDIRLRSELTVVE
jgi:beta-glucosidase